MTDPLSRLVRGCALLEDPGNEHGPCPHRACLYAGIKIPLSLLDRLRLQSTQQQVNELLRETRTFDDGRVLHGLTYLPLCKRPKLKGVYIAVALDLVKDFEETTSVLQLAKNLKAALVAHVKGTLVASQTAAVTSVWTAAVCAGAEGSIDRIRFDVQMSMEASGPLLDDLRRQLVKGARPCELAAVPSLSGFTFRARLDNPSQLPLPAPAAVAPMSSVAEQPEEISAEAPPQAQTAAPPQHPPAELIVTPRTPPLPQGDLQPPSSLSPPSSPMAAGLDIHNVFGDARLERDFSRPSSPSPPSSSVATELDIDALFVEADQARQLPVVPVRNPRRGPSKPLAKRRPPPPPLIISEPLSESDSEASPDAEEFDRVLAKELDQALEEERLARNMRIAAAFAAELQARADEAARQRALRAVTLTNLTNGEPRPKYRYDSRLSWEYPASSSSSTALYRSTQGGSYSEVDLRELASRRQVQHQRMGFNTANKENAKPAELPSTSGRGHKRDLSTDTCERPAKQFKPAAI